MSIPLSDAILALLDGRNYAVLATGPAVPARYHPAARNIGGTGVVLGA